MILEYLALGAVCLLVMVGYTVTAIALGDMKRTRLKPVPRVIAQILIVVVLALPALWVTVRAFS